MAATCSRIFIVEDHPAMRQSLVALIENEADFTVTGEAASAEETKSHLDTGATDLVLIDISLPGQDGIALIKWLQREHPRLPALVVSGHESAIYGQPVLGAGARGYVMKRHIQQLLPAMRAVLAGGTYLSEDR